MYSWLPQAAWTLLASGYRSSYRVSGVLGLHLSSYLHSPILTTKEGCQLGYNQWLLFDKGVQKMRREAWCTQLHLEREGRSEGVQTNL